MMEAFRSFSGVLVWLRLCKLSHASLADEFAYRPLKLSMGMCYRYTCKVMKLRKLAVGVSQLENFATGSKHQNRSKNMRLGRVSLLVPLEIADQTVSEQLRMLKKARDFLGLRLKLRVMRVNQCVLKLNSCIFEALYSRFELRQCTLQLQQVRWSMTKIWRKVRSEPLVKITSNTNSVVTIHGLSATLRKRLSQYSRQTIYLLASSKPTCPVISFSNSRLVPQPWELLFHRLDLPKRPPPCSCAGTDCNDDTKQGLIPICPKFDAVGNSLIRVISLNDRIGEFTKPRLCGCPGKCNHNRSEEKSHRQSPTRILHDRPPLSLSFTGESTFGKEVR